MRSHFVAAIVIVSTVLAAGTPSHASVSARKITGAAVSSGSSDLISIKAAYASRRDGFLSRNGGQLYSGTTPDFILSERSGGKLSRAATIQRASANMSALTRLIGAGADPQALTYTIEILSASFSGNQATVIESGQVHALSISSAAASAYASAAGAFNGVYRDLWVRTPQGWKQKSSSKL